MKNFLCYVGIVFLIGMIALPPLLRAFVKKNEDSKPVIIDILNCNGENDSIFASYTDKKIQKYQYKIKGNYLINNEDTSNKEEGATDTENELLYTSKKYGEVFYDEENELTQYTIDFVNFGDIPTEFSNATEPERFQTYLTSLKYSCTITNYDDKQQ